MLKNVKTSPPGEKIVLSLGGSLISRSDSELAIDFLKNFSEFIRGAIIENPKRQFFIIVGGGALAREYQKSLATLLGKEASARDLDEIGIGATRLNARLVQLLFDELAAPEILTDYSDLPDFKESIVVGAGWQPGASTDYDAVLLAARYNVKTIFNLSVIEGVYLTNPKQGSKSKVIDKLSWPDFRMLFGDSWSPGKNVPFDPVAAKHAEAGGIRVVVVNGKNLENLKAAILGKSFQGTAIE